MKRRVLLVLPFGAYAGACIWDAVRFAQDGRPADLATAFAWLVLGIAWLAEIGKNR